MPSHDFKTFADFWPFYLSEHRSRCNRWLHFAGTSLGLSCLGAAFWLQKPLWALGLPIAGYAFAWFGHFVVERNRPATFRYPLWSLLGDFKLFFMMLAGRIK